MRYPLIALFCLLFCCGGDCSAQQKSDLEQSGLKGRVKSISEAMYEINNDSGKAKNGRLVKKAFTNYNEHGYATSSTGSCDIHLKRNSLNMTKLITMSFGNFIGRYDHKNNLVYQLNFDCKGILQDSTTFVYDTEGRDVGSTMYGPDGKETWQDVKILDNKGRVVEDRSRHDNSSSKTLHTYNDVGKMTTQYYVCDTVKYSWVNNYNSQNNITEALQWGQDDKPKKTIYKYNAVEQLKLQTTYDVNDSITEWHCYKYDGKGNQIADSQYLVTDAFRYSYMTMKYSTKNKLISKETYVAKQLRYHEMYDTAGRKILEVEYEYDNSRKLLTTKSTKRVYDAHGEEVRTEEKLVERNPYYREGQKHSSKFYTTNWISTHRFTYDRTGNLIKKEDFDNDVPVYTTSYDIVYY